MMAPDNSTKGGQNQGVEMFEGYSLPGGPPFGFAQGRPLGVGMLAIEYPYPTVRQWRSGAPSSELTDESFCFHNAANCPDCEGGMVKQGGCFSCPACGFSVCS